METPNAENILVGSNTFYVDPTHLRPIPSDLLRYLTEYHGFHRSEVARLQAPLTSHQRIEAGIFGVLAGVSMDYAVVALAGQDAQAEAILETWIDTLQEVSLHEACSTYDKFRSEQLTQQLDAMKLQIEHLSQRQTEIISGLTDLAKTIEKHHVPFRSHLQRLRNIVAHLNSKVNSNMLRRCRHAMTPLRWLAARIRQIARLAAGR